MRRAIVARDFALSSEHGPVPSRDFVWPFWCLETNASAAWHHEYPSVDAAR